MQVENAGRGLAEAGDAEDLRTDMTVQPGEHQTGDLADARDRLLCLRERETELLVLVGRGEEVVGLGVHAADHADQHALARTGARRDRCEPFDLDGAVDDDRPDADLDGTLELGDPTCCCRENRAKAGATPAARATASSPPVQTSTRSPSSTIQRAIVVHRNALPA